MTFFLLEQDVYTALRTVLSGLSVKGDVSFGDLFVAFAESSSSGE